MPTRRTFLRWSAAAVLFGSSTLSRPPRALRIGTLLGPADVELERGVDFGVREAHRTGALFGWAVERVILGRAERSGVDAVVAAQPASARFVDLPYMALRCHAAPSPDTFILPRCDVPADAEASAAADRRVVSWHDSLERFGAAQLNDRYRAATGAAMTGEAWLGWISVKILLDAAMRARTSEPQALRAQLLHPATHFDGHKGEPLRFMSDRRLAHPVYEIARREGDEWRVIRQIAPAGQS